MSISRAWSINQQRHKNHHRRRNHLLHHLHLPKTTIFTAQSQTNMKKKHRQSGQRNNNGAGGRDGKKPEKDVARVVSGSTYFSKLGPRVEKRHVCVETARFAQPAVGAILRVQPRRPCCGKEEKIYLPSPSGEGKIFFRPAPPNKKQIAVPSSRGGGIFTVPSCREN